MPRGASLVIPIVLLIAITILFFTHYFIYFSMVRFFGLAAGGRRNALALILFLFPASFIASSILGRWTAGRLPDTVYFVSALWLGAALTLMTCLILAWGAWGVTKLFAHSPSPAVFGWTALAVACLYTSYGVLNAYRPRVKELTVRIKNLPPVWRQRKIVQLSDVHLGHILGESFMARLVERTNAQKPSIVFITGDLFDGSDRRLEELIRPLNDLDAPLGTYYVTGNHETFLGTERAYQALKATSVKILKDQMVVIDGVQIIGIAYPERGQHKDLGKVIRNIPGFDPRQPSILLYHSPTNIEQAKAAGIRLQLSGHTHHGQIFPIQFISRLVYGKYYNGLHVEGDYTLYTSSGAGTWGPTMRTGNDPEIAVIHLEE